MQKLTKFWQTELWTTQTHIFEQYLSLKFLQNMKQILAFLHTPLIVWLSLLYINMELKTYSPVLAAASVGLCPDTLLGCQCVRITGVWERNRVTRTINTYSSASPRNLCWLFEWHDSTLTFNTVIRTPPNSPLSITCTMQISRCRHTSEFSRRKLGHFKGQHLMVWLARFRHL